MSKGGRPKDLIWVHFYRLEEESKVTAQCKLCLHVQTCKPERMKTHYAKCSKQSKQSDPAVAPDDAVVPQIQAEKRASSLTESSQPPRKKQADLSSHVVCTTGAEKEELDQSVAEFVFGLNLPFSVVEHRLFKDMLSKNVTMQQDGWSTVSNDPVIATSVSVDGHVCFV